MNTLTIPEIIDAFGGASAFGRVIEVNQSTASEMKRRRSIPVRYWPKVIGADPVDRPRFSYDDLVNAHCREVEAA